MIENIEINVNNQKATLSELNSKYIQYNTLQESLPIGTDDTNLNYTYDESIKNNKGIISTLLTQVTARGKVYSSPINLFNALFAKASEAASQVAGAKAKADEAIASVNALSTLPETVTNLQSAIESLQSTVDGLVANGGSGSGSGSGSTQPVNLDGYVTTEDLNTRLADYATTAALNTVSESIPNSTDFVTTTDLGTTLENYATKAEIPSDPDLSGYATTESLPDFNTFATKDELTGYAKTSDIPSAPDLSDYVTTEALTTALNTYATKEELNSYVTTTALTGYNYVTSDALTSTLNTRLADYMTATEVNQAIAAYAANNSVDGLTLDFVELTAEEKASLVAEPPANLLDIINARMPLDTATAEQIEAYSKKIYVVPSFEDGNNDCTEFYVNTKNNPPTWEVFGTAVESLDEIIVAHIEDVPENN